MDYIKTPKKKFKDAIESKQLSFNINDLFHGKYGTVVITERQSNGIYTTKTTTISNNNSTPMKTPTTSTIANNNNYNNDNNTSNNNYKSSKYKPSSTLMEKVTNNVDNNNLEITPTTPKQQGFQLFSPNVAIKTQQMTKKSIAITPIREYKIQKELTKLAVGKINLFPSVVDYFQSISCPEDDLNDEENNENQKKRKRSSKQEQQQVGYFNIIMEKADGNLTELIKKYNTNKTKKGNCKLPIVIVQNILFQILFALHVAQSLCKFQHNDMHIGNILFKYLPCITKKEEIKRDGIAFFEIFNNKEYIWITKCDFVIKIADYGLSRIYSKEEDEIIHSGKGHNGGSDFNQCIDLEKLKEIMQSKLVIDSSLCETREEKEMLKSYSDLKRMIKAHCGVQPKDLLQHEFFNSLKVLSTTTTTTGMSVSGKDDNNNDELIRYYHYYGSNHPKREENIEQPAIMIQSPMRMNKTKSIYNNNNNGNNNNSNNSNNNNKGSSSSGNAVSVVAVGKKKKKNKFIKETIKSNGDGDVSSDDTKVNNGGATIAKSSEAIVSATTRMTTISSGNVAVNESEEIIEDNNTTKIVKRKRRKLIRSVVTDEEEEQN